MQKFDFDSEKDLDRLAMMYEMTLDEPERIPEPKTEHPYVPSFLSDKKSELGLAFRSLLSKDCGGTGALGFASPAGVCYGILKVAKQCGLSRRHISHYVKFGCAEAAAFIVEHIPTEEFIREYGTYEDFVIKFCNNLDYDDLGFDYGLCVLDAVEKVSPGAVVAARGADGRDALDHAASSFVIAGNGYHCAEVLRYIGAFFGEEGLNRAEAHIKRIREKAAERDAEVETSESENDVSIEDVDDSKL